MQMRSLLLLAAFASLCTGVPACDTGCPSGENRVCNEDGRDCECLEACESHADCESGQYCVESINSCDFVSSAI